jgi:hypothetical protein
MVILFWAAELTCKCVPRATGKSVTISSSGGWPSDASQSPLCALVKDDKEPCVRRVAECSWYCAFEEASDARGCEEFGYVCCELRWV